MIGACVDDGDQIIKVMNCSIQVPDHVVIPYIEGDGCGPEVVGAARQVVDNAINKIYANKRTILWKEVFAGQKAFTTAGNWLPEETIHALKKYHIGMKGPLNTPVGEGIRSLNVTMRKELDLYINLRPVKYYFPVPSPLHNPEQVDIILFRENTEDIYSGIEFESESTETDTFLAIFKNTFPSQYAKIRFPSTSAFSIKPISREGSERIIRAAVQWALKNQRKTVTILHKGNIMKFTEGGFLNWGYSLAEQEFRDLVYTMRQWKFTAQQSGESKANHDLEKAKSDGKLIIKDMIMDAAFERAISHPQDMDVLVTTNLNGDYFSDALAALVGGLGIAPGANINFNTGDAIFEAVHGTAPNIAGKNQANPCSLILSSMLMLRYMGWSEAADLIENALRKTLASRNVTVDFYEQMKNSTLRSTSDFTKHLIQRM